MTLKPEIMAQIQAMLKADLSMVTQLQAAADNESAVTLLAAAAAANGITVSAPELTAHMQEATAKHAEMSDAELEELAGGVGWMYMSVRATCRRKNPVTHSDA